MASIEGESMRQCCIRSFDSIDVTLVRPLLLLVSPPLLDLFAAAACGMSGEDDNRNTGGGVSFNEDSRSNPWEGGEKLSILR